MPPFTIESASLDQMSSNAPDWLEDVFIYWGTRDGVPSVKLLTKSGRALVAECDEAGFQQFNGREWQALHPDGTLMTQYVHSGALKHIGHKRYQTSQWQGFGGRVFTVKTVAGDVVDLRGPWFGKAPLNWHAVHMIGKDRMSNGGTSKPWHAFSGQFGIFVSEDALIRCLLQSKENIGLARVNGRIEPYLTMDGGPKRFKP